MVESVLLMLAGVRLGVGNTILVNKDNTPLLKVSHRVIMTRAVLSRQRTPIVNRIKNVERRSIREISKSLLHEGTKEAGRKVREVHLAATTMLDLIAILRH